MGEGSLAVLETWGELGKSLATKYKSIIGNVPQPREALTQGIFPLKLPFAYLQPALSQMSRGTKDDCEPVVMEMLVLSGAQVPWEVSRRISGFVVLAPSLRFYSLSRVTKKGCPPTASQALVVALLTAGMKQRNAADGG